MPEIHISVQDKIARTEGRPEIICGNNDYFAVFDLDSEWDIFEIKTARFVWRDALSGTLQYSDVLFSGSRVQIPAVYNTDLMLAGVYAGDIRTSTPIRILCRGGITDSSPEHEEPKHDVYTQLLALLEAIDTGTSAQFEQMAYLYPHKIAVGICGILKEES